MKAPLIPQMTAPQSPLTQVPPENLLMAVASMDKQGAFANAAPPGPKSPPPKRGHGGLRVVR